MASYINWLDYRPDKSEVLSSNLSEATRSSRFSKNVKSRNDGIGRHVVLRKLCLGVQVRVLFPVLWGGSLIGKVSSLQLEG